MIFFFHNKKVFLYLHDQLMCSCNQSQAVIVIKCFGNVLSKGVTSTARRDAPAAPVIGVRPQQITHGSFVGDFLDSIQGPNLIKGINRWRQTSMKTKDLNHCVSIIVCSLGKEVYRDDVPDPQ